MNINEDYTPLVVILKPDFDKLRPYLFTNWSTTAFNELIKLVKKHKYELYLNYITDGPSDPLVKNLQIILGKYDLGDHETNLLYMILTQHKQTYIDVTQYRLPNLNVPKRLDAFIELINFLVDHRDKKFKIKFEQVGDDAHPNLRKRIAKRNNKVKSKVDLENPYLNNKYKPQEVKGLKPIEFLCDNQHVNDWMFTTLLDQIINKNYNLNMGHQLINSQVLCDIKSKKYLFKLNAPNAALEQNSENSIWKDAIINMCLPLINYLNFETKANKGVAEYWSSNQLSFLVEVLVVIQYYLPKTQFFKDTLKFKPSIGDKDYLDKVLRNSKEKGMWQAISPINK